jgi:hypothetical protein
MYINEIYEIKIKYLRDILEVKVLNDIVGNSLIGKLL